MVIAAGAIRFNFVKFVIADGIAALVSGGLFVYLGYLAGKHFGSVADVRRRIDQYEQYVLIGAILVATVFVTCLLWRHRRRKAEREAVERLGQTEPDRAGAEIRG